jgi:hypothetical protein
MKSISTIALVVAVIALALALNKKEASSSIDVQETNEALRAEVQELQERLAALEKRGRPMVVEAPNVQSLERQVDDLANNQQDIAELTLGIDLLGVLETQEREVMNAYEILTDVEQPAGIRAKQAALLKRYGQFDQQAVDSMWELFSNPRQTYDQASALLALTGYVTPENRDEVLTALNRDVEGGYENGRFRYYVIEALEPLLPDPEVRSWLTHLAQNDPEVKVANRAARSVRIQLP